MWFYYTLQMRGILPVGVLSGTAGCDTGRGVRPGVRAERFKVEGSSGRPLSSPALVFLLAIQQKAYFLLSCYFFLESYRHLIMPLHMCQNFLNFK